MAATAQKEPSVCETPRSTALLLSARRAELSQLFTKFSLLFPRGEGEGEEGWPWTVKQKAYLHLLSNKRIIMM